LIHSSTVGPERRRYNAANGPIFTVVANALAEGGETSMNKLTTGAELEQGTPVPGEMELARLIVTTLNLEVRAEDIDPQAPLYGEGLGLDSIDILEIALAASRVYGVKLRSDDADNRKIFGSLRALNHYIQQHRTK
jgi:acyl carrier protein